MPIFTRSQKKREDERENPFCNVGNREENPFHRLQEQGNGLNDEIIDEMLN